MTVRKQQTIYRLSIFLCYRTPNWLRANPPHLSHEIYKTQLIYGIKLFQEELEEEEITLEET